MSTKSRIVLFSIIPLITLFIGWKAGVTAEQTRLNMFMISTQNGAEFADPEETTDISLLWNVWRILQSHYVHPEELQSNEMVLGAVEGMVEAVGDPYTVFMTPEQNTDFRDALSGHLEGIGAELAQRDNQIVVVSPLKGSPAQKAGLLPDDIIVTANGEDLAGKNLYDVVDIIRGPRGTTVELSVYREDTNGLLTFTITRADITVPSTEYEVKTTANGNVGYLAINQFGSETISEVREIMKSVDENSLKGLIIDLRYNGGGYLDGAIDLVSMFVQEGAVATVAGRDDQSLTHYVNGNPTHLTIPLVVLINEGSASASEIAAGALQDYDRATIVGMQSFGKGTVQEVLDLPGGSSLRVTIARWLTPDGHDIGKQGITPDVEVNRTREDFEADKDPQLDAALEILAK